MFEIYKSFGKYFLIAHGMARSPLFLELGENTGSIGSVVQGFHPVLDISFIKILNTLSAKLILVYGKYLVITEKAQCEIIQACYITTQ